MYKYTVFLKISISTSKIGNDRLKEEEEEEKEEEIYSFPQRV